MKKVFYFVAASLMLSSCLENKVIEEYNEDFENVFGATDPNHTWKMVENQEVEVSVDKPSRVKIYVLLGNTYRLAADYENVSGTRTLSYDAPMGCEDIYVTVDGVPYQGVNSRAENQEIVSPVTAKGDFKQFTYEQISTFHNGGDKLPETKDNTGRVTATGCRIISNGQPYTFYPVYWGGIFYHTYGLYYYENRELKTCEFYSNKVDDSLQYLDANGDWKDVTIDYAYDHFFPKEGTKPVYANETPVLRSKCYTINLPKGTEFGFYVTIKQKSGLSSQPFNERGTFYSDPELNSASQENKPFSAFAYLHIDDDSNHNHNTTYITVEDYNDNDYNDFIFMLEGEHNHVEETPHKYIYAVEDLGGSNDFDFNDVVFSVSHVAGKVNATVQPLAAGGIYKANICFNGKSYGEIHSKFGVESSVMVNTKRGTTKASMVKVDPFLVEVGAEWSHTAYGNSGNGFSVEVEIPNKKDKVLTTYVPGDDSAPQMLVLSENWLWPTEKTRISEAYPSFGEWGANYTNQTWINSYATGSVVNWKE